MQVEERGYTKIAQEITQIEEVIFSRSVTKYSSYANKTDEEAR